MEEKKRRRIIRNKKVGTKVPGTYLIFNGIPISTEVEKDNK